MSVLFYVFDTSYLIELANCGRDSDPKAHKRVRKMFAKAEAAKARFVVPLPCLFELGDHIADVDHEKRRHELADWLLKTVTASLERSRPFIITPTGTPGEVLPALLLRFQGKTVQKQIGLVDTFTAVEAERLKQKYGDDHARVHIWTNDRALKGLEPDREANPFHW